MIAWRAALAVFAATSVAMIAAAAHAQVYPERLIKVIVPQGPGGPTDLLARASAQRLQAALGQNVVAENRGGRHQDRLNMRMFRTSGYRFSGKNMGKIKGRQG
jgi:hypothetical protein